MIEGGDEGGDGDSIDEDGNCDAGTTTSSAGFTAFSPRAAIFALRKAAAVAAASTTDPVVSTVLFVVDGTVGGDGVDFTPFTSFDNTGTESTEETTDTDEEIGKGGIKSMAPVTNAIRPSARARIFARRAALASSTDDIFNHSVKRL